MLGSLSLINDLMWQEWLEAFHRREQHKKLTDHRERKNKLEEINDNKEETTYEEGEVGKAVDRFPSPLTLKQASSSLKLLSFFPGLCGCREQPAHEAPA